MNADTASPTTPSTPAPVPTGPSLPVVPVPGATEPPHTHEHTKAEPNALLLWSKKAWEGLKAGHVGNPRILLLAVAAVAIAAAIWFLLFSSKKTDSALWSGFDQALTNEGLNTFAGDPANANTMAAKIAKLNDLRLRKDLNLRKLTDSRQKLADRVGAADTLEKLRDELSESAGQFKDDRTLKAQSLLAAAEIEMGLIGIPKKGVATMGVDVKGNCRGQLDKYAGLMKQAAEAIGVDSEAGKEILAAADKYSKDPAAGELYRRLGDFHSRFNDPDPIDPTKSTDPNAPKTPDTIPGNPKPGETTTPGDAPKPPEGNPFDKK